MVCQSGAELWIVAVEAVETVGAHGDDLLDAHALEVFDVRLGHFDELHLVAHHLGGVTGAAGLFQNTVGNPRRVQDPDHGAGDLLGAFLVGDRAANPQQILGLAHLEERHFETRTPVLGAGRGADERVLARFQVAVCRCHVLGHFGTVHHEVATEFQDRLRGVVADRAHLHTGRARGAVEHGVLAQHIDQGGVIQLALLEVFGADDHHLLRGQIFPRLGGGAHVVTTPAPQARRSVQKVFLGQVCQPGGPKGRLLLFVLVFLFVQTKINGRQVDARTGVRQRAVGRPQQHVREGREGNEGDERHAEQPVQPPQQVEAGGGPIASKRPG